jgi:hypothetical protein
MLCEGVGLIKGFKLGREIILIYFKKLSNK